MLSFEVHTVSAGTPILLSIDDMDGLGIFLNNLNDILVHLQSRLNAIVTRTRRHPFIKWNPRTFCSLMTSELRQLHQNFGHPSTDKLMKVLEKPGIADVVPVTSRVLNHIKRGCNTCQTYAQKPCRFKLTLRNDNYFTHSVYADIFYIEKKPNPVYF